MTETEMMEVWTKLATPGAEHHLLGRYTGQWKVHMKSWMDPNQPAMESDGEATFGSMFDGRIRTEKFVGDAMGMPFEGFAMTGYDNFQQKFWLTWSDNMSTGLMYCGEGTLSPDKKVITYLGTMDKPTTGEKGVKTKYIYRLLDDNHFVFETYEQRQGVDVQTMEIDYQRQK